jgi:hypothetical protein
MTVGSARVPVTGSGAEATLARQISPRLSRVADRRGTIHPTKENILFKPWGGRAAPRRQFLVPFTLISFHFLKYGFGTRGGVVVGELCYKQDFLFLT